MTTYTITVDNGRASASVKVTSDWLEYGYMNGCLDTLAPLVLDLMNKCDEVKDENWLKKQRRIDNSFGGTD